MQFNYKLFRDGYLLDQMAGQAYWDQSGASDLQPSLMMGLQASNETGAGPPKIRSIEELQDEENLLEAAPNDLNAAAITAMEKLLRAMVRKLREYSAHDVNGAGDDYIISPTQGGAHPGLPYLVCRVHGGSTTWEKCTTDGQRIDFIKRFMVALPWWQEGYLSAKKANRDEARARLHQVQAALESVNETKD
jgi:hypothetical protein